MSDARTPLVSDWLRARDGDLEALSARYHVYFTRHEADALVLLCYHSVRSPRDVPMVNQCRGLVLRAGSWEPVAWGMERFLNDTEGDAAAAALVAPLRVEEKVDGTLITLFADRGAWRACTRHTFCELDPPYLELTLAACGCASPGELAARAGLDPAMTWCFELCGPRNRVVRRYDQPTLYLLAGYHTRARAAASDGELDAIAARFGPGLARPPVYACEGGVAAAEALVARLASDEPLFEGVVVKDARGARLKLKSARYRVIHQLKYRGWARLTPRLLVPEILRGRDRQLLVALDGLRDDLDAFWLRRDRWAGRVDAELARLCTLSAALPPGDRRGAAAVIERATDCLTRRFLLRHHDDLDGRPLELARARALLAEHAERATALMFPKGQIDDPCADIYDEHPPRYCPPPARLADRGIAAEAPARDDAGGWRVRCYCGASMELARLRVDRVHARACHCGGRFGLHRYGVGTLLWTCTRPGCPCTHEAHPRARRWDDEDVEYGAGAPLGVPASVACKALRLQLHERLAALRRAWRVDRGAVYRWLSRELGRPRERTHVALFDAPTCAAMIRAVERALASDPGIT